PLATLVMSFDVWQHSLPHIEIYGSEGSLSVPDPNTFRGPVRLWRHDNPAWHEVPLSHREDVMHSIGAADMVHAIAAGRAHRANGQMAYHVLDTMHALLEASAQGAHIALASTCDQPALLPEGLPDRLLD
ncbi:MAG: gfo/Idh/MocA family oxidoreductase, partial [Anaerolineae bacterium]|nr:gfo/Idh/MocA family oxidoreductase [Anaerolineae bacterium]